MICHDNLRDASVLYEDYSIGQVSEFHMVSAQNASLVSEHTY